LGLPNGLTAVRAWACCPLFLCATLTFQHSLGLILWCTVGFVVGNLDFADGYIARRWGPITALGKAIDPAMYVLFFSMGAVGCALLGIVPWWLTALVVFRYFAPLLGTPIVFLTGRRPELVHTKWGRRNTAAVGLVYFILMWFKIFSGPVDVAAVIVGIPLLVPSMLLHFRDLIRRVADAPKAA
jgi:phosphatidylglycerophosphate synthase